MKRQKDDNAAAQRERQQNPHQRHPYQPYMAQAEHYGQQFIPYGYYAGDMGAYHRYMAQEQYR